MRSGVEQHCVVVVLKYDCAPPLTTEGSKSVGKRAPTKMTTQMSMEYVTGLLLPQSTILEFRRPLIQQISRSKP